MKIKTILATVICFSSMLGLTACGGSGGSQEETTPPQENTGGNNTGGNNTGGDTTGGDTTDGDNTGGDSAPVGHIAGIVSSEVTDINACQLYLYGNEVTNFADAFDQSHANFQTPSSPITSTAPISVGNISSSGEYRFENIDTGNYKLVLNCLIGQDIQDESQLIDDPIQYDGHTIPNPAGIIPNILSITVTKGITSNNNFIDSRVKPVIDETVDVIVKANITDLSNHKEELHDLWSTVNRIAPKNGVTTMDTLKVNVVRMLGGIVKKDENGNKVPDLDYDTATYNEQTGQYEYNFQPLIKRINAIIDKDKQLYQIVLDQPPWAFQRGHKFIPDTQEFDGISFKESQRISHYGNSLPPKDKAAYNDFLQATMNRLVAEYGKETVLSWRFRIGTEIETPDHWYGTEQDFVEHFANSVNAIRAILPNAIIGVHTRSPNFVYKNGTVTNYKGEAIKSFANTLIEYCYDNNISYDFWGLSDYPFITQASTRDPKTKYDQFFKPLVDHPKWQQGTVIDVEEYSVITRMGFVPPIYAYITSNSPQADTFNVALTDEFYQNKVNQVFQWGLRNGDKPWPVEVFSTMFGKPRISVEVNSETVGSVVVTDMNDDSIEAVTYHYDPQSLEAENDRNVKLTFNVDKPVETTFYYRKKLAAPKNHTFYNFMEQPSAINWLKTDQNYYNKYGAPNIVLNDTGLAQWESYQNPTPVTWTQWQSASTIARTDAESGSQVNISSLLPLFSFEKIQIKWTDN